MSDVSKTVRDRPERKPKAPKLPRTDMPCQPAKQRAANFEEVTLGYDMDMAMLEASRLPAVQEAQMRTRLPSRHRHPRCRQDDCGR